jgi:hypothetical protein
VLQRSGNRVEPTKVKRGMKILGGIRLAALSLLLLPAACAQVADAASPGVAVPLPDGVALQVEYIGGFVRPTTLFTRLPLVTVYADGRVITEGPQIAVYPPPALPNVQLQRISTGDVDKLVALATAAGVGTPTDLGTPGVTDVPSTRFTVLTKDGVKTNEVYALNEGLGDQSGLTPPQNAARAKLRELVQALSDLPSTLGAGAVSTGEQYVPTAVAAVASPWVASEDTNLPTSPEMVWPGPNLPGKPLAEGMDLGCVEAGGDAATKVLKAATSATELTPWTSGGKRWTVALRPLLPDESSCADLGK